MSKTLLETLKGITLENFQDMNIIESQLEKVYYTYDAILDVAPYNCNNIMCKNKRFDIRTTRIFSFIRFIERIKSLGIAKYARLLKDFDSRNGVDEQVNLYVNEIERLYLESNNISKYYQFSDIKDIKHYKVYDDATVDMKNIVNNMFEYKYLNKECQNFIDKGVKLNINKVARCLDKMHNKLDIINKRMSYHINYRNLSILYYFAVILKEFILEFDTEELDALSDLKVFGVSKLDMQRLYYILINNELDNALLKKDLDFEYNLVLKRLDKMSNDVLGCVVCDLTTSSTNIDISKRQMFQEDVYTIVQKIWQFIYAVLYDKYQLESDFLPDEITNFEREFLVVNELGNVVNPQCSDCIDSSTEGATNLYRFHAIHKMKEFTQKFSKDEIVKYIISYYKYVIDKYKYEVDSIDDIEFVCCFKEIIQELRELVIIGAVESNRMVNQSEEDVFIMNFFDNIIDCKNDKNETIDLFERIDYKYDGDLSDKELIEYALDVLYKLELKYDVFKECLKNEYALVTNMFDSMINNL